ncbi:MAG: hypothetical protein N2253_05760 [Bacteroidia bacterium]|nr:hypothetical protein [Bacteroidia bacterium]
MRRAVPFLGVVWGVSWGQAIWVEKAGEHSAPSFSAQVYRLSAERWVLFFKVNLAPWLPYVFDTTLSVRLQVQTKEGIIAETLFTLPAAPEWSGSIEGHFPERLAGQMTILYLSFPDAPGGVYHARVFWRSGYTPIWVEATSTILDLPVRLRTQSGETKLAMPGDSLWNLVFSPAKVDTTIPPPPYVLRSSKKSRLRVEIGCAWHLRGDTSTVFWTCREAPLPYAPSKGSSFTPSPSEWNTAYRLFSDIKPGERSDRGMVYLFYGLPPVRLHTPYQEIWVYPEAGLSFHFVWKGGTWELIRRLEYQSIWHRR